MSLPGGSRVGHSSSPPVRSRKAIRDGAASIGELKYHLALDSPEMRRIYSVWADLQAPVMMHIQTFPHFPGELPYNTGYPEFDTVLRAYLKTNSSGTATRFARTSAPMFLPIEGYPSGPIKPAGLTDKLLSDYPYLDS